MRLPYFVLLLVLFAACKAEPPLQPREAPVAEVVPAPEASFEPLAGEWIQTLRDADGTPVGVVTVPLASRTPKGLVVGVHGALSRPDWMCGAVRDSFGPDTFVLCPHPSSKLQQVASWGSGPQLVSAVDRALAAAFATFGERIDRRHLVYFGHSQGSMMLPAAYATTKATTPFASVVFFEGLPKDTSHLERTVRNMGADQILFVSGQGGWASAHATQAASLEKKGLRARHVKGGFGHFFNAEALAIVRREAPILLAPAS